MRDILRIPSWLASPEKAVASDQCSVISFNAPSFHCSPKSRDQRSEIMKMFDQGIEN